MKASNPYSQSTDPFSWLGWENGFASNPNATISQFEKDEYGPRYWKAYYRGQGAQIVKNYEQPSALTELEFIVKSAR
jgi:hypothetical protein